MPRANILHAPTDGLKPEGMPQHIAPMLASLTGKLPRNQRDFAAEFKWDGVRAIRFYDSRSVRLESRNLLDITHRYPELVPLSHALKRRSTILDGEIIALDERARPNFSLLQRRMHASRITPAMRKITIVYMVFDVLHLDGYSLMSLPYGQRRTLLEDLQLSGPAWQTPPSYVGSLHETLSAATQAGLEGIVLKQLDSAYAPGARSREWLKIKVTQRQEFVIGGYTLGEGSHREMIGSLLLGFYDSGGGRSVLRYAGGVGTGFTDADHRRIKPMLEKRRRSSSPFADPVPKPNAIFVEPELVTEVEFREWTHGGILRHPSFKGLRLDKPAHEVVRENYL